jgi:ribose transport system substrate-binding protein
MKKLAVCLVVAMVVAMLVVPAVFAEKKLTFVMVPKGVHPYYEPCFEGFKAAGEKYGITVEYEAPQKFDIALQVKVLEDLISRGVNGIAISALDDKPLVPVIKQALDAGIQVLTFDAPAPSSAQLSYIGTDNENSGYEAGKKLAELMGKKGELAILQGGLGAPNLNLRRQGLEKAFKEVAPDIKIVTVADEEGKFDLAVNKTEALLEAYPNLAAIFSVSAEGAPAASKVLKAQNKADKIIVAGYDDLKDTLEGIKDGSVKFCVVQKTFKMGWLSVEKLLAATKGEKIEPLIDTGVVFVEKGNVDTYMAEMKKEFAGK